jgi:argininosuccinate lyase
MVDKGMSFRDAYNEISKSIKKKSFKPKKRVKQTLLGGIDNLCLEKIKMKMNRNF